MDSPLDNTLTAAAYASELSGFTQLYGTIGALGRLPESRQVWLEAAADATDRLNLRPQEIRQILRIPQGTPANDVERIGALPGAAETFFRMTLLRNAAQELTAIFQGDARCVGKWLRVAHNGGPYQAQPPLQAVMTGASYQLKYLQSYLRQS